MAPNLVLRALVLGSGGATVVAGCDGGLEMLSTAVLSTYLPWLLVPPVQCCS